MANEDRILKILLQLQADTADSAKVTGALKDIQAQAEETADSVNKINAPATGATVPIDRANMSAQLAAEADIKAKMLATDTEAATVTAATTAMMERRVIMETQLEAAEARIAGNPALAVRLEREAEIRLQALTVQRALNVSTEESIALAERLVLAQEASVAPTALMGVNLNKAKGEATVLAREIATGSASARTVGALLGSLGPAITVAALAGYELYQVIAHAGDEALKLAQDIDKATSEVIKQQQEWNELARAAGDFGDALKLADKIAPELSKVQANLAELRAKDLEGWRSWLTSVVKIMSVLATTKLGPLANFVDPTALLKSLSGPLDAAKASADLLARQQFQAATSALDVAQHAEEFWNRIKEMPVSQGIEIYTQKVAELKAKFDSIDRTKSPADLDAWRQAGHELDLYQTRLEQLQKINAKVGDESSNFVLKDRQALIDAARLRGENVDAAQHQLNVDEKISQLTKANADALKDGRMTQVEINALAEKEVTNAEKSKEAKQSARDAQKDIAAYLEEESVLVQKIHASTAAIDQNPFLSIDEKDTLKISLIASEISDLNAKIADGKDKLAGGTLDPQQYNRVEKAVITLQGRVVSLQFDLQKLSFGGTVQAGLTSWANQFIEAGKQVTTFITGTLNTAISSTSQALTGLIFGTKNWQQAFASAAQSIVQNIIQIALQYVVSKLVMAAIDRVTGQTTSSAATDAASTAAAAWAPAAISAAIASYGEAAYTGIGAYAIALGAGEALAVGSAAVAGSAGGSGGGFEKGGYTGEGSKDEVAGPVHRREFVFSAEETSALGVPFLRALANAGGGVAHFSGGGYAERDRLDYDTDFPETRETGGIPYDQRIGYPTGQEVAINPSNYIGDPGAPNVGTGDPGSPRWVSPSVASYPSLSGTPSGDWAQNARRGGGGGSGGGDIASGFFGPAGGGFDARGFPANSGQDLAGFGIGGSGLVGFGGGGGGGGGGGPAGPMGSYPIVRVYHGGGQVDDIPALLAAGEFVMRKAAVDYHGVDLMHAMNAARVPVRQFAEGGHVDNIRSTTDHNAAKSSAAKGDTHVFVLMNEDEMRKRVLASDAGRKIMIDHFRGRRLDFT